MLLFPYFSTSISALVSRSFKQRRTNKLCMSIGKTQLYAFNFRKMEYRKGHSYVLGYIRELMQRRFRDAAATGRVIKLILARFYADESTVEASF